MTAPIPALSTSADVEAVLAMQLRVLGVETPNPRYWSTNREFCEDVARDLVKTLAALSSPTTEGYAHVRRAPDGPCLLACPHNPPHFGDCAVGAGSAVKALGQAAAEIRLSRAYALGHQIADDLDTRADFLAQDADRTPPEYNVAALLNVPRSRRQRQEPETSSPGAGSAVEALVSDWQANGNSRPLGDPTAETWHQAARQLMDAIAQDADRTSRGGALGPLTDDERLHVMTEYAVDGKSWTDVERAINRVLAARATRPAPDDQAEGER